MKNFALLAVLALLLLAASPQQTATQTVTLLDDDSVSQHRSGQATLDGLIRELGLQVIPEDRLYLNGQPANRQSSLASGQPNTLQIRRARPVTINTPQGETEILFSGWTVAEALRQSGILLYAADFAAPSGGLPLNGLQAIEFIPSREVALRLDGNEIRIRTSAARVGQALAAAGIPLLGLDSSLPGESAVLPGPDVIIEINRIYETVSLFQSALPFESQYVATAELELDQENLLQIGEPGLSVSRVRTRYENGEQVSQVSEEETIIRPPQDRIVGYGTRVVEKTLDVGGQTITYWRAIQMYATSYSPCRSGVPGRCFTGTSSGIPVRKGVVAMYRSWYLQLRGMQVYVPGYGTAVIADVGGGFPDGRPWIDLGYSDDDYEAWSGWVTVYFLAPIPETIPYVLD